jgi:hypothetical protein
LTAAVLAAIGLTDAHAQPVVDGNCVTYTTAIDFRAGQLFNLEPIVDPATGDACLRLTTEAIKPWPFIGVAISGYNNAQVRRGSVMRIATEDIPSLGINEGDVIGEYFTAPAGMNNDPSRTTVDAFGNIWVGNRRENNGKGSVTRVGMVLGGVRGDKVPVAGGGFNFVANPLGEYLQGPFNYCNCDDRDGDGLIRTSRGYPHTTGAFNADFVATALDWTNLPAGIDTNGGVASADDECITAFVRTEGTGVRHISFDSNNDVWVGGMDNRRFEKLDNTTATQVPLTAFTAPNFAGGYGGIVDSCGILWSGTWGPQFNPRILRFDTNTMTATTPSIHNYGVSYDPVTCEIWTSTPYQSNAFHFPSSGAPVTTVPHASAATNRGIVVSNSEVWIANSTSNTLSRFTTAGVPIGSGLVSVSYAGVPFVPGDNPHGVAADAADKIWAINRLTHNAVRIDPTLGAADLAVDLGPDAWAYNYSDMTGSQLLSIAPQGSWTFIHDGGMPGCEWEYVDWSAILTNNAQIMVRLRASDSPLPNGPWTMVQANVPFAGVVGQYLQVQITLKQGVSNNPGEECCRPTGEALLCDFTICKKASCSAELVEVYCVPEFGDPDDPDDMLKKVVATIKVTNNSGVDATEIRITPLPTGGPVTASPMRIFQNVAGNGAMHTFDVMFENLIDGVEFCFVVTLVDETGNVCCSTVVCFTPDCDCLQIRDANEYIVCSPDGVPGSYLYTFQFDNLTPDTIHHIYLTPPPGVTITPDYVALTPPVGPGATSQQIMVMITGATPGTELCFDIDIHDEFLNQCCRQEVKVEIPFCDDKQSRGACCYERPGVPQAICTVTTQQDCEQNLMGVYLGDNSACNPSPCLPEPGETEINFTKFRTCCWPIDQSVTMTLSICNNSAVARSYGWTVGSMPGPGCPNPILPNFIMPNMGTVMVPPGGCVDIPVEVFCEGALSGMGISCLQAMVTDLATNQTYTSTGMIRSLVIDPASPLPQWCMPEIDPSIGVVRLAADEIFNASIIVSNVGTASGALFYEVQAGGVLRINGNDPGFGFMNYATAAPGTSTTRRFTVGFDEPRPGQFFDVMIFADLDSDGEREPAMSMTFQTFDPEGCAGDTNNDGAVNFADLNTVLSCFGFTGEPGHLLGDLDRNGIVDFADLNEVLSNFGQGCN